MIGQKDISPPFPIFFPALNNAAYAGWLWRIVQMQACWVLSLPPPPKTSLIVVQSTVSFPHFSVFQRRPEEATRPSKWFCIVRFFIWICSTNKCLPHSQLRMMRLLWEHRFFSLQIIMKKIPKQTNTNNRSYYSKNKQRNVHRSTWEMPWSLLLLQKQTEEKKKNC